MKNRKTFIVWFLAFLAFILVVGSPFVGFTIWSFSMPPQFYETYLGGLTDKFNRLTTIKEKKIIIVGGSSVPFSLRSDLIEKEIPDYKVVNFGLYGTLGTKVMMDLSKANISEGDLIIFSPEINEQALSLYFNPETMLECLDSNWNMFNYLETNNQRQVAGHFYNYTMLKNKYNTEKNMSLSGVYQRKNLNEHGDIAYFLRDQDGNLIYDEDEKPMSMRKYNKMAKGYNPDDQINYDYKMVSDDFIQYVRSYSSFVKSKGAKILYAFSPSNIAATNVSNIDYASFYTFVKEHFDMDVIGSPGEYVLDPLYFYDTNFHLNDSGAIYRTGKLILDIRQHYKDNTPLDFELPDPPEIPDDDLSQGGGPDTSSFFKYSDYLFNNEKKTGLSITGVADDHLGDLSLDLPWHDDYVPIKNIAQGAFINTTNLKTINVNRNIKHISAEAFSGCRYLEKIVMDKDTNPEDVMITLYGTMLTGCNENVKIFVPASKYAQYANEYSWKHYSSYLETY